MDDSLISRLSEEVFQSLKCLASSNTDDTIGKDGLGHLAAHFYLWREGFSTEDLDSLMVFSSDFAATILLHLIAISRSLLSLLQKHRKNQSVRSSIDVVSFEALVAQSVQHMHRLHPVEYEMIDEAISDDDRSDTSSNDGHSTHSTIEHRIRLLMRLVPAMQQALSGYHQRKDDAIPPEPQTLLIPLAPQNGHENRFRNLMHSLSTTPTKYENPGLLDEAMTKVPLDRIYAHAEEEFELLKAIAATSSGHNLSRPQWGYQDCLMQSLLRWFSKEFFRFTTNPKCSECSGPTIGVGDTPATDDEAARGATKVELYKCTVHTCNGYERFPRYSDVWVLLETRRGRAGEFANCFGMLARALGARVRWIWNSEDHVWNEVYSQHQKRWIHVDPCEAFWDRPRVYTEEWKRKLAYCIAFSNDGATDVTRRYVRNPAVHGLARTRVPEATLLWIMLEIRKVRRVNMSQEAIDKLSSEDELEERELAGYISDVIVQHKMDLATHPGADPSNWKTQRKTSSTETHQPAQSTAF